MKEALQLVLSNVSPLARRLGVALLVGTGVLLFLFLTLWERDKSYSSHARTRGLDIVFNEKPISSWLLPEMFVCFRRDGADATVESLGPGQTPLCSPGLYQVERFAQEELSWPEGAHLQISRVGPETPLEIDVLAAGAVPLELGGVSLPDRSRLIIPSEAWSEAGTLPLEGSITIGDTPSSGSQRNLVEGTYSISEVVTGYNKPVEVVSGMFRSGDVVRMADDRGAGDVFGFIEPAGSGAAGFLATMFSSPGGSRMELYRYGIADLQIEPSLLDRALRNPLLLALGALLAVTGVVSGAVQLVRWIVFGGGSGGRTD